MHYAQSAASGLVIGIRTVIPTGILIALVLKRKVLVMEYHVHTRYSQWHRLRVQMAGGVIAALLPYLIRLTLIWANPTLGMESGNSVQTLHLTFAVSLVAILSGTMIMRSMGNYPGVEGSASILPVFSATFACSLLFFVMGRLEYNRSALAGAYVLTLIWFYSIYFLDQRRVLRIGILPAATTEIPFAEIKRVEAVHLSSPEDRPASINAIAADFRINMSPEWERRLADDALAGVPVFHIKHLIESLTGQVALEHLSETSYGTLSPPAAYVRIKQIFDWLMAAIAAVVLSPVLLAIAVIIRLDSPGPAIFRQRRVGYRGYSFTVFKFRTMTHARAVVDSERDAITRSDDARITRVGAFLRQSRLDELPQIFNILLGEMSWIGPRPEAEVLSRWYEKDIPFYRYRHIVRPGITGWAQVNQGHVAEVAEVTSKLHYDFYYIKNCSPWIDLLIIARTIKTMVTGFGAR